MPLHRLTSLTLGVPDVAAAAAYYGEFGLTPSSDDLVSIYDEVATVPGAEHRFSTTDGGEQLHIVHSPRRRLVELGVGCHDRDDLARVSSSLQQLGLDPVTDGASLRVTDAGTAVTVVVSIAPELAQQPVTVPAHNRPGRADRVGARADAVERDQRVRPRKLGHVVIGSTDQQASQALFTDGLGFKLSDEVRGLAAFLRCSTDHHNVLVQQSPVPLLHHTSWQVDDVDEIGRGASAMLATDPGRHIWGLGRHHIGSNLFWYLKDPAGNFSEYYCDMDCIIDDQLWTPQDWSGMQALYSWGPPPPPSFIAPDDLTELMAGLHTSTAGP